ncbi:MAG: menaquinone biosynthesis protein [Planctomycetota bacterium]
MRPLRVAAVSYLNARPLIADLESDSRLQLDPCPPAEVARKLLDQRADLGLVPCVTLLEDESLSYLPGLCIAARGAVDSVFLYLRKGALTAAQASPDLRLDLRLDPCSRSSQMLTRIFLEDFEGVDPRRIHYRSANPTEAFSGDEARADGVLVIGDRALGLAAPPGFERIDLAEAWRRQTGFPFVFAVWGLKEDLLNRHPWLPERFRAALEQGLKQLPDIVDAFAEPLAVDRGVAIAYLQDRIQFRLGALEEQGMTEFLARARAKPKSVTTE